MATEEHFHDAHDKLYGKPTLRRLTRYDGTPEDAVGAAEAVVQAAPGLSAPPPRTGSGSGRDAQAAYATDVLGLTVTDDMGRDEIADLIDEHTKE
jgi:hypothetical protein